MLGNCLVEFKVIARFTIQIHARHIQSERPETRKNIFILPLKYSFQTSNLPKSVISKLKARHFLWMKKSLLFTFLIYFVSLYWKISFTFSRNSKSEINITFTIWSCRALPDITSGSPEIFQNRDCPETGRFSFPDARLFKSFLFVYFFKEKKFQFDEFQ